MFTYTPPTATGIGAITLNNLSASTSGIGSLAYNNSTGVFTYVGPSATEVRDQISAGEGIDISSGVISGEDATDTNKGIASFSSDNFSVGTGAVTIKNAGVNADELNVGTGAGQIDTDVIPESATKFYYTEGRFTTSLSNKTTSDLSEGTNLYYTDARVQAISIDNVVEDLTPVLLGGPLDPKGQMIGPDSTRDYQIIGNQATPSADNFDSFSSSGARVHGVVTINEVTGPTNRIHSNPRLSLVTMDADVSGSANAGRLRQNYVEGVLQTDGFDNTTTGFGKGHNGMFVSGKVENNHASNASVVSESNTLTLTPQIDTTQDLTVTSMKGINIQAYCADGTATAVQNNFYGIYVDVPTGSDAGLIGSTARHSFYGNDADATLYNKGGITPGAFASGSLPTLPAGTQIAVSDAASTTNGTNNYQPAYTTGGGNWFFVSNDLAV